MQKKLKEIANVRSGYLFRHRLRDDENGNVSIVQLRDVDENGTLSYETLLKVKAEKPDKFDFLSKGDVLFKAKSNKRVATVIEKDIPNLVATVHYFIVTLKNDFLIPEYVAWFLNQNPAQEYFTLNAMGTRVPIVNKKALGDIPIAFPEKEKQRLIIKINGLKNKEISILDQIKEKRASLINGTLIASLKK